jgi:hypothetical protein
MKRPDPARCRSLLAGDSARVSSDDFNHRLPAGSCLPFRRA